MFVSSHDVIDMMSCDVMLVQWVEARYVQSMFVSPHKLICHVMSCNVTLVPVGGGSPALPRSSRPSGLRQEEAEDHVGTVLGIPPALLQVPLHSCQGARGS